MGWVADVLGHELFGTTISVLELAISFVGLFGGGYVGTRTGALSRMRVEDRRELLDEILPGIDELQGPVFYDYQADVPEQPDIDRAEALVGSVDKGDHIVDLLPWLDRREWRRFVDHTPYPEASRFTVQSRTVDWAVDDAKNGRISPEALFKAQEELNSRLDRYVDRRLEVVTVTPPGDEIREESNTEYEKARGEIRTHLRYVLRPTLTRRLMTSLRTVRHGVRAGIESARWRWS